MKAVNLLILLWFKTVLSERSIINEIRKLCQHYGISYKENNFMTRSSNHAEYDFIVVGSGPAGSVIANRLSEIPHWNVLLLEKGSEGNIFSDIPLLAIRTRNSSISRVYEAEREPGVCLGLVGKRCYWPAGHALGGATLINAVMHTRGFPDDYDGWAYEGSYGWSYREVLPYFLKSENISIRRLLDSEFHSTKGPLPVTYPYTTRLAKMFLRAGQELGYDIIDYSNPYTVTGFGHAYANQRKGRKYSAAQAFLIPYLSRPNLHVIKEALVTKVLITPETKRAYGVKYLKNGVEKTVLATNEVILSAGAFGSAQLLMLSGIGPIDDLERLKIPVIEDLPVGKNLQDQPSTPALIFLINTTDSITLPKMLFTSPIDFIQWYKFGSNIFADNGAEAVAFVKSSYAGSSPDIELILAPGSLVSDGGTFIRRNLYITDEVYHKTWGNIKFREAFAIGPLYMYPKSRGEVKLMSRDPRDPLHIKNNFFSDPIDMKILIEAVRIAMRVGEAESFQRVGAKLHKVPVHGCESLEFNSDEYWECAIRTVTIHFHHQCGTCKMGPDPYTSVVDPRLKVYGIAGLRVADASIMPTIVGPHTMAPCYMIGEKAADMIKEDWGIYINA